jgi:hypothetical protein
MRSLLAALSVLFMAGVASGEAVQLKRGPVRQSMIPGLVDGTGDESTLEYVKRLPSFQGLPTIPEVYVSASGNGGWWPEGNDACAGTLDCPIRSWEKMQDIAQGQQVHFILDPGDEWNGFESSSTQTLGTLAGGLQSKMSTSGIVRLCLGLLAATSSGLTRERH